MKYTSGSVGSARARRARRSATELRLRTSEDNLRLTFEAAPIGMALVDLEGHFLRANPALGVILGRDADGLIGTTFQEITHPDDLELDLEQMRGCLDGSIDGYEMEKRYVHPDGREVWAHLNVALARDGRGAPMHFVAQIVDITERRSAAASLAASEARFAALIEHSREVVSIVDREGRLLYASPAYAKVLGVDPSARLGTPIHDHIHPDDHAAVIDAATSLYDQPGATTDVLFRYAHADGSWLWFEATMTNRHDDATVGGLVTNARDVTERVRAAERLAHQATHDALTGLPNRALLEERMVQARAAADRHGELLAALFVDVDHFKDVNDTHGHGVGDLLLRHVATRLRDAARVEDTVARLGGDEFVIIAGVTDSAAAAGLAARACAAFDAPFALKDLALDVSCSVGLATTRSTTGDLVEAADTALYEAKAAGRARWVAYIDEMARPDGRADRHRRRDALRRDSDESTPRPLTTSSDLDRVAALYRAHVAESTQALVVHNDGVIVAASPPALRLMAAPDETAVIRRHVFEFVTAESLASAHARYDSMNDGIWPQPDVLEIATLSGQRLAVEVTSTPVLWDGVVASQLTLRPADEVPIERDGTDPPADLLEELAAGLPAGELVVAYQPIIRIDGSPAKVEALVRWQHPERGLLLPGAFVPAAERSPLIGALTAEVLRQSCAQVAEWRRSGAPDLELAVNISGRELGDPTLARRVLDALESSGLPATALWLEVTETAVAHESRLASTEIEKLSALGVRFALDDFGTGFATLAQLHRFPAHALKIDRLFVDGVTSDESGDVAIVRSVLALGRELGLVVIAEGVETEAQREALSRLGCELFQGYFFAQPSAAEPPPPWLPIVCATAGAA